MKKTVIPFLMWTAIACGQSTAINCGGPAIANFQADAFFSGPTAAYADPTMGAAELATLRYGTSFSYDVPVAGNGVYTIALEMVEPNKTGIGQRVFTVTANGTISAPIDLFALTGGQKRKYSLTMTANVTASVVHLQFVGTAGQNAVISAITITPPAAAPTSSPGIAPCVDTSTTVNTIVCANLPSSPTIGFSTIVFAAQNTNAVGVTINGVAAFHRDGGGYSATDVLQSGLPTLFTFDGTVWREPYARLVAGGSGMLSTDYSTNPPLVDGVSSVLPCLPCANVWTGLNDFTGAILKLPVTAAAGSVSFVDGEIPAGTIDGTNAVFILAAAPNPPTSLHLHNNGLRLSPIIRSNGSFISGDFDLAGATITFGNGGGCGNVGVPASDNITLTGTVQAGDVVTVTINGASVQYTAQPGDNYLQVMGALSLAITATQAMNVVAAAAGDQSIAIAAQIGGVAGNAYTLAVSFALTPGSTFGATVFSPTFVGGNTLTCVGAIPQPGDMLVADYRK